MKGVIRKPQAWHKNIKLETKQGGILLKKPDISYEMKERLQKETLNSKPDPFKIPLIKISSEDRYLVVFGKRIVQTVQLIYFGLISLLIWIGSIMPG